MKVGDIVLMDNGKWQQKYLVTRYILDTYELTRVMLPKTKADSNRFPVIMRISVKAQARILTNDGI